MSQSLPAQMITLRDLIDRFGLTLTEDESFFPEWQENLPEIGERDRDRGSEVSSRIRPGYNRAAKSLEAISPPLANPQPENRSPLTIAC